MLLILIPRQQMHRRELDVRERFFFPLRGVCRLTITHFQQGTLPGKLGALGLYGVLTYAVRQRSTEIGIRVALGATAVHIRALVFRQAATVVSLGIAAGLASTLMLGGWIETLAFGIAASDARILVASAIVLALVALVAAWLPARRAVNVEPRMAMHEGD